MRLVAVAAALLALLASGCGGDGESCGGGGTDAKESAGTASELAFLTDVRLTGDGCDELELVFESVRPAVRVAYEPRETALVEDGSGRLLQADGDAFLVVRLEPAATARVSDDGGVTPTYDGPKRIDGEGGPVLEVVQTGNFEAVIRWTVALPEERPFSLSVSEGLVVVEIPD